MAHREEGKRLARERIAAERAAQQARAKRNRRIQIIAVVVVVLAIVAGGIWWQSNRSAIATTADKGPQVPATKTDDGVTIGTAGTTVDIYLDFLCPHCAELEERLGDTLDEMVTAGDITLALHPVTLIDPTQSARAAAAFACAADSGTDSMLGYERALYANQSGDTSAAALIEIAKSVGITGPTFTSCVNDDEQLDWAAGVNTAAQTAVAKVSDSFGTPTIIINGKLVDLSRTEDPDDFRATVQELGGS